MIGRSGGLLTSLSRDIRTPPGRFVGGDLNKLLGAYGPLAVAVVGVLITLAIARFLHERRIFQRV